jgi:hypothetical protein
LQPPQIIYGRDDLPEEVAFTLARALDDNCHLFRLWLLSTARTPTGRPGELQALFSGGVIGLGNQPIENRSLIRRVGGGKVGSA